MKSFGVKILVIIVLAFSGAYAVTGYLDYYYTKKNLANSPAMPAIKKKVVRSDSEIKNIITDIKKDTPKKNVVSKKSNPRNIVLTGIIGGDSPRAVFKVDKQVKVYRLGEDYGNLKVNSIEGNTVNMTFNGSVYEYSLKDNKKVNKALESLSEEGVVAEDITLEKEALINLIDAKAPFRGLRLSPQRNNGNVVGYKLNRVEIVQWLAELGIQEGDILTKLNGNDIKSVTLLQQIIQDFVSLDNIDIELMRDNKIISYRINFI